MDLVFDGVTLTKAPQSLSMRQKHAAQAIKAMWMKKGEAMSPEVHTYNRYSLSCNQTWLITWGQHGQTICKNLILQLAGPCCPSVVIRLWFIFAEYGVQLGVKVPLWGGFSAHGGFALKLWTQKAKMDKEQWAGHIPALKSAASQANNCHNLSCWKTFRLCSCLFLFSFGVCCFVGLCCHSIKALGAKGWRCGWTTKGFSK